MMSVIQLDRRIKILKSKMEDVSHLKNNKSQYLENRSADFDEILRDDTY